MIIEIPDEVAEATGLNEEEMRQFLAVYLYKKERINGVQGGKIMGTSEPEFHGLLEKYDEYVNYNSEDFMEDKDSLEDF